MRFSFLLILALLAGAVSARLTVSRRELDEELKDYYGLTDEQDQVVESLYGSGSEGIANVENADLPKAYPSENASAPASLIDEILWEAVENGNASVVYDALWAGADANSRSEEGKGTPLFVAIEREDVEVIKDLLDHGADANAVDEIGDTPLWLALEASKDHRDEIVRALVSHGSDTNKVGVDGTPPLFWAVSENDAELTSILLNGGADTNLRGPDNSTALTVALATPDIHHAIVEDLLDHGADANAPGEGGTTPLELAEGDEHLTQLLESHGATPPAAAPAPAPAP